MDEFESISETRIHQPYKLRNLANGGWIIERGVTAGMAPEEIGAYSNTNEMLSALHQLLNEGKGS